MATMASRAKITRLLSNLTHKTLSFASGSRSNGARGQIRVNPFGVFKFTFSSSAAPLESNINRQIGKKYGVKHSKAEILNRYRWAYEQPWSRSKLN
ncbi:hypothetical protein LOK49_LG10G02686 [Camellia lanceoleosa]|uniref:Uncharacterized protein n=1 Tax=Camellia lanceoleosa TaxID=1840588 RepID=A0ACC0G9H4_9ERIC|nr:hypothetical protein LOK49_LG10G02686 [Camellia lanceoleosa]